jgi:hypothetical protein
MAAAKPEHAPAVIRRRHDASLLGTSASVLVDRTKPKTGGYDLGEAKLR